MDVACILAEITVLAFAACLPLTLPVVMQRPAAKLPAVPIAPPAEQPTAQRILLQALPPTSAAKPATASTMTTADAVHPALPLITAGAATARDARLSRNNSP